MSKFVNTGASKADKPDTTNSPISRWNVYDSVDQVFSGRTQPKYGIHGGICCSQSQITSIGLYILQCGGGSIDACIAIAAGLSVVEPMSTGIGGDCFVLHYDSVTHQVEGLNGSGRSPRELHHTHIVDTHATYDSKDKTKVVGLHPLSVHSVTVPGAVAGWCDAYDKWSNKKLSLLQLLQPAIDLANNGFVVGSVTAAMWSTWSNVLRQTEYGSELLKSDGTAPTAGEIMTNKHMGRVLQLIGEHGKSAFYEGSVGNSIIDAMNQRGGLMTQNDLSSHQSTLVKPITVQYNGIDIHEIPPNGSGITVLLALNIIKKLNLLHKYQHNSVEHLHLLIECMRIAFVDTRWYVTDSDHSDTRDKHGPIPVQQLLSDEYAQSRAKLFNESKATIDVQRGSPVVSSDTVSFVAVDNAGNATSFINSLYMGFGSGIVPKQCGFALQNRGANFVIDVDHPNHLQGNKRPYHTIIPGMATRNNQLYAPFSVMGGFMYVLYCIVLYCRSYQYISIGTQTNTPIYIYVVVFVQATPRSCSDVSSYDRL